MNGLRENINTVGCFSFVNLTAKLMPLKSVEKKNFLPILNTTKADKFSYP